MMEKLGAPQTHLGLKAMIKVNNEQKSICFSFLLWSHTSFRDQVHLSNFLSKKILALLILIFACERPNGSLRFGSSAELGGSARFGRTTEPSVFTEP